MGRLTQIINRGFERLGKGYRRYLAVVLRHRLWIFIIVLALIAGAYTLYRKLPQDLAPQESIGIINTWVSAPVGSNVDYTEQYTQKVASSIRSLLPKALIYAWSGFGSPHHAELDALLPNLGASNVDMPALVLKVGNMLKQIPGAHTTTFMPSFFGGGDSEGGINFLLLSNQDYTHLYEEGKAIVAKLKQVPGMSDVVLRMDYDTQQYAAEINRALANDVGVSGEQIANILAVFLGGRHVGDFSLHNKNYEVIVQAEQQFRKTPDALKQYYVRSASGKLLPIANLVTLKPTLGLWGLHHQDGLRSVRINAHLMPNMTLGDAVNYLQDWLPKQLTDGDRFVFSGAAERYLESSHTLTRLFLYSLIFIFLVLAAQFESFIDPLIILTTVPLSVLGAAATLKWLGGSLNIYTEIALVTLLGLITKHGVLITQFANQLVAKKDSVFSAVQQAALIRLRPILMTTLAMILGAVPLAFAQGAGAASRHQLGWAIIGGMFFGTFFSLILVPVAYTFFKTLAGKR